ncbi:hypothetical protein [Streptomyces torulosus]|uniref:hypothetical protein n=1 Tax=Streptomyces torulosus TaxID=68276 RepID=UPI0006EB73BD|nr:hypothetical protein [Streptomyces torulosus]
MIGWVFFFAVLLAPCIIGITSAVRAASRVTKADQAMRALAARPGWEQVVRRKGGDQWVGYASHFPALMSTYLMTTVTGPLDGNQVTICRFLKMTVESRNQAHWLLVHFELPGDRTPILRLERHWSAAHLGLRFAHDVPYLPLSDNRRATADQFYASDLPQRLAKLAGPAVSFMGDQACFAYFPLPEVVDMGNLLKGLAALLPDLAALAREIPREDETEHA